MEAQDLKTILGIVINLVSNDRVLDQDSTGVRDFNLAATNLIAQLNGGKSRNGAGEVVPKQ